jgi:hypothetical protein
MNISVLLLCAFFFLNSIFAQKKGSTTTTSITILPEKFTYPNAVKKENYHIAVLTPMYLDSFDLVENLANIPSYAAPGIDFYVGAKLAADTLDKIGVKVAIHVLDAKGAHMNMNTLIESGQLDSVDCIIGNIGGADLKTIADYANSKKVNFISAVSPNDGEQYNNAYFTLLQPRLTTHMERLHKVIEGKHAGAQIHFFHRDATAENNAYNYYKNDTLKSTTTLKEYIQTDNTIDSNVLLKVLSKEKNNILVLANLDAKTAYQNLLLLKSFVDEGYRITVYGMPTWDNIKSIKTTGTLDGMDIFFTSPILVDKITGPYQYISRKYKAFMGTPITDIAYKGFEATYYVAGLLNKHGVPFNDKIDDAGPSFVTPYRIKTVRENKKLRYLENKFLYVAHYFNGILTYE